jgi:Flp pilus assembly secretin CpaC
MKNQKHFASLNRLKALLALAAIFALGITISFGAHRALGRPLDAQPTETELKAARDQTAASIPRLPNDTEAKLAAALYPEIPAAANISDPFVDHGGVKSTVTSIQTSSMASALISSPISLQPQIPERNSRLSQWQQSVRAAVNSGSTLPPMTSAYLVSEMSPTGRLDMNGRQGVWLYIESEKRTIAANIGAKFYDGMLVGVNSDGAQFRTAGGQTKLVPWNRQEDFTTTSPSATTIDPSAPQRQQTIVPPKPVSQTIPRSGQNDYSDLQEAVRDRYSQRTSRAPQAPADAPTTIAPSLENTTVMITPAQADPAPSQDRNDDLQITIDATDTEPRGVRQVSFNHAVYKPVTEASPSPSPSPLASPTPAPPQTKKPAARPSPQQTAALPPKTNPAASAADSSPTPQPPQKRNPVCDPNYRGAPITITNESNRPLSLLSLVNHLNQSYGANIVLDYDVQETPVRLTVTDTPWTSVLHTLLDLNDLDTVCLDGRIVQIAKRMKIAQISEQRRKSAPIIREVFKLRYLQPTAGGRANLAGQTQSSNGATIQSLEDAIRDILKAGGDARGEARRVPGRNELLVAATQQQMDEIRDLISRVDRPGYQVKISALVYTANENRLRDIGSQLSVVVGNTANTNIAGATTLPNVSTSSGSGSGTSNGQGVAGVNPGGIPGLATGMRQPSNGLGATNPVATFGGSVLFGTAQFAYQLTLAQQSGAVNIQSRPFGIVSDGDTFDLVAGTQIPVVTTTIAGGAPFQSGQVQFIEASRIARITPQVAENEQGQPNFVTLNIQLENNSVDTSLGTFNGVPGVNRQSLQTVLRLRNGETVVIGGLAADQVSNSRSKVPGLGDIPAIGNLFKRKQNQENRDRLYFAITVEVIPQEAAMPNFQAPADAMTTQPQPPKAQKPSPFEKRH